jgi:enediyne biosynthesis thioesterase
MRSFEYRHRVLLEDTSVAGDVYFTRYFSWQGRCRELFLLERAPDVLERLRGDLALVTTRCSCEYLGEALPGDEIRVCMRLDRLAQNLIDLDFEYWNAEGSLIARGAQQVACMRREAGRAVPEPVPGSLIAALEAYQPGAVR